MNQLQWLFDCMKSKLKLFWVAMALAVISSGLYIFYPFITKQITDTVLLQSLDMAKTVLPGLLAFLLVTQFVRSILRYIMTGILEFVSQDMQEKIRMHIFNNLCKQDLFFYNKYRTGDLMTRLTGDMDMVRHTVSWISYNTLESISIFIASVIYLFSINALLTLSLLALTPIIFFTTRIYCKNVFPLYSALRERHSVMNSTAQENIAGNKTVRAFARENFECEKFEKCNSEYRTANLEANDYWLKFFPVIEGCSQILPVLTVLVGGYLIITGKMTMGDLAAFTLLTWGISEPMRSLGVYVNDFQRFLTSANKIIEIYYAKTGITPTLNGKTQGDGAQGTVEFENVSFKYSKNANALNDVSFKVGTGQTLAIIGTTGSGKTTLINAITRMLDVTSGKVLVNGTDVRHWDLGALRRQIGVATQKVMLYSDSVAANVAYAEPLMPIEEIEIFASLAQANFAKTLPEGFETVIGEQGTGLSGGQKQRIALARALAKKPSILILDDTTSAVDLETEKALRDSLANLPYPCTKIMIAQRISSVKNADIILVMHEGEITASGTHAQLIETSEYYRSICQLQGIEIQEVA